MTLGNSLVAHLLVDALVDGDFHLVDVALGGRSLRGTVHVLVTPYGFELVCV